MSEADNAAIVRRGMDAWNRGDLDEIIELADPAVEVTLSGAFPDLDRNYRGHDGFRDFWELFRGSWRELTVEVIEIEPAGDAVLASTVYHGVGRDGVEVERAFHFVFHLRAGKITSYQTFSDATLARVAAGLGA